MARRGWRGVWVLVLAGMASGCGGPTADEAGAPAAGGSYVRAGKASSSSVSTRASPWSVPCARGRSRGWWFRIRSRWAS